MSKYVSLDKRSKKAQKEYHSKQRRTWGELNPVTRSVPSGKVYNRKKEKERISKEFRDGFGADFFHHELTVCLKEYCGCGIGAAMLQTVLNVAKEAGYEQAELEVMAENENAIVMYEKLGFKKYGTFPDNMKYADGEYMDAYWMMKKL